MIRHADTAEEVLAALASDDQAMVPEARELVESLVEHAPSLVVLVARDPEIVRDVLARPLEHGDDAASHAATFRTATAALEDGDELRRVLRRLRHRAIVRIAAREIQRLADVDETSAELAWLAGAAVDAAIAACSRTVTREHAEPRDRAGAVIPFVAIGMGKLGGEELNVGSDVDLCFFYGTDDGTVGETGLAPHEVFAKIASRTARAIGDVTADGFVFRVDLRLRPEGARGPLVNSLASAERYYETFGRTWERAALSRARPVGGDLSLGRELLDALAPFVYRRTVDPTIALEMGEMLARTRAELSVDEERDVKLGRGGIREAEFFVQTLQLVWGGRHPELRVPGTIEAARRLLAAGLITERESRTLGADWALLRRVEHRIQLHAGYQTHALPQPGEARERFARSLGLADAATLERDLGAARDRIASLFASLRAGDAPPTPELARLADRVADGATAAELTADAVRALGVDDTDEAASHLVRLGRRPTAPLGPLSREAHPELGALLLAETRDSASPDLALRHLADFFSRLHSPEGYTRLLAEEPRLARRLVGLFGTSPTLSNASPELLHDVLLQRSPPTESEIEQAHARVRPSLVDPEHTVDTIRRLLHETMLSIGLFSVTGELDIHATGQLLAALAAAQIGLALDVATRETCARFGEPLAVDGEPPGLVVVGLGKLGGRELDLGADLDLLFLYRADGDTAPAADGSRTTHAELYTRIAQRTMRILSEPSAAGRGYTTDTRLRPSGAQGLLVVSLHAFDRYHDTEAAPWERQALVRARPLAGEATLRAAAERRIRALAYERGAPSAESVAEMRRRMELELAGERPGRYHTKLGYGGLTDVEFVVQFLQMRHGDDDAVRTPGTWEALGALAARGHLDALDADALARGWELARGCIQALRLRDEVEEPYLYEGGRTAEHVAKRLGLRDRDGQRASEVLVTTWMRTAASVREVFERIVAPVGTRAPWERAA